MTKKMRDLENAGYTRERKTSDKVLAKKIAAEYRDKGCRAQVTSLQRTSGDRNRDSVRYRTSITYTVWIKILSEEKTK